MSWFNSPDVAGVHRLAHELPLETMSDPNR